MNLLIGIMLGVLPMQSATRPAFHAHNDYLHSRPLFDALDQGFDSVEVDVFLANNELLVGHFFWEVKPERTLESLYLLPLSKLNKEGRLKNIWLMVDIKSNEVERSAMILDQQLRRYPGLFARVGEKDDAPVKVLLSGNMPREWVCSGKSNLLRLDGREGELGNAEQAAIFPWVSEPWSKHFSWKGKGPISEIEKNKLKTMALKAASAKQQLRFWGAPDLPECWKIQADSGVQRIGTDNLPGLAKHKFN
jgi:hypothetical protein